MTTLPLQNPSFDTQILDYKTVRYHYCNGYCSIGFRTDKPDYDINKNNFILNSCNDGWFRKDNSCGISSSHGLLIRSIKITSRKPVLVGDFLCHKASVVYETNDFDPIVVEDKFWVFVHRKFEVEDVLNYIEEKKGEWVA